MLLKLLKKLFWGRTITTQTCTELVCFVREAASSTSKEQIIQYDKIYHHTLLKLGYSGTFGEILKRNPKEIKNIQDVWELHKLRNSLVHELKSRDEQMLQKEARRYKGICERFIKQVTE